jgi:serine/threonine protein kinase
MAVQDFASSMIDGLDRLHGMGISHGSICPETILLDNNKLVVSAFSSARLLDANATFQNDLEMTASTILFALSGGLAEGELDFADLLEAAKTGFADDGLFDGIRAGRLEICSARGSAVSRRSTIC